MNGDLCTLEEFLSAIVRMNHLNAEDIRQGYEDGFRGEVGTGQKSQAYWRSHGNGSEARARGAHQPPLEDTEGGEV